MSILSTDNAKRKALPLYDFMFKYFPDAWLEIAKVAVEGNKQHNPGEPLHWAREKSTDQLNTAFRHLFDHGTGCTFDEDGCRHLAKTVWRLMAAMQLAIERDRGYVNHHAQKPLAFQFYRGNDPINLDILKTVSRNYAPGFDIRQHHGLAINGRFYPSDNCEFNQGHPCDACREWHTAKPELTAGQQKQQTAFRPDPYTGG